MKRSGERKGSERSERTERDKMKRRSRIKVERTYNYWEKYPLQLNPRFTTGDPVHPQFTFQMMEPTTFVDF